MRKFIRDIVEKDHLQEVFLVKDKNSGKDRNGKAFLSLTVMDSSGHLNARMFEKAEEVTGLFEVGDAVWIKGFVQLFQNRKQLIVNEVRRATEAEIHMPDLIPQLGGDPKKHLQELLNIVSEIKNDHIRILLESTLNDPLTKAALLKAPAAKTIHHAYFGGLVEHIHSIVQLMISLSQNYKFLDLDLLVFGAIYHDLGKIYELELQDGIHYTTSGRLVGHMALACEMIVHHSAKIDGFPPDLLDILKHIVLSHHGKLEYGSPKLPMLPEAMIVAMIDDLDSKMNTLFHFLKNEVESVKPQEKWSHFHPGFERYFYLDYFRKQIKSEV